MNIHPASPETHSRFSLSICACAAHVAVAVAVALLLASRSRTRRIRHCARARPARFVAFRSVWPAATFTSTSTRSPFRVPHTCVHVGLAYLFACCMLLVCAIRLSLANALRIYTLYVAAYLFTHLYVCSLQRIRYTSRAAL